MIIESWIWRFDRCMRCWIVSSSLISSCLLLLALDLLMVSLAPCHSYFVFELTVRHSGVILILCLSWRWDIVVSAVLLGWQKLIFVLELMVRHSVRCSALGLAEADQSFSWNLFRLSSLLNLGYQFGLGWAMDGCIWSSFHVGLEMDFFFLF